MIRALVTSAILLLGIGSSAFARGMGDGPAPLPTPTPDGAAVQKRDGKKNDRPASAKTDGVSHVSASESVNAAKPAYFYEFTRPGFVYSPVKIEHDEDGRGKISFNKDGYETVITDPIALSPVTLGRIKEILVAMNFLDSTEEYQFDRDYSHLGNVTISVKKDGRERTVKYNWTTDKNAKDLMDEYRRISNEYTWLFELALALENQPLRTPGLMAALDSYLGRNEIPDPPHLIPFLTALSTDERLPLIARNHALRIVKNIEKSKR